MADNFRRIHAPPEETLDDLYEHAPCGYLAMDTAGRVVRANATLLEWLGVPREALIGQPVQTIFTRAGRIFFESHVAPMLSVEGGARQVALDLARVDKSRMPVLTDWRSVTIQGQPMGVRVMLVDATDRRAYERDLVAERQRLEETARQLRVSEQRLLEMNETLEARVAERTAELEIAHEQLRQSQKLEAIGNLTGGVAHDFNNLLSPIIGGLDMLQSRGIGDERARLMIGNALDAAERAQTLVQRLLAFARRQPLRPVAVDIGALLHGMANLIASTMGARNSLVLSVPEALPAALADANQIEMALLNLAVNARDAMPDGGTLTITATLEADAPSDHPDGQCPRYIRLAVTDTGVGMDEATLERAIEPFFSTKGPGQGTGLGLSMVHGLAAQLGGRLSLHSAPGRGTSIELDLPVAL